MTKTLLYGALCCLALTLAACATNARMDGGISGTGTRIDCEPKTRPDGTAVPLPEECKQQSTAPR